MLKHLRFLALFLFLPYARAWALDDPYEHYVMTSKDFQPVKQDRQWLLKAFGNWTYMPWTFKWNIGYTDESGKWSVDHGYNGAFIDHGDISAQMSNTGKLDWINQWRLPFYMDHTAGKHYLHIWDGDEVAKHANAIHGTGVRTPPVNSAMQQTLEAMIRDHIANVKSSPMRAAYALDDEISWGSFIRPCMWKVTDDRQAYQSWLGEIYGNAAPHPLDWISYNDIEPNLKEWTIARFDASPLMDQWTFNDSYWNNFVGDLVQYANTQDPQTPCGFVGGQAPNAFGGYDYAKVMRKVQFLEAYDLGSSQAIIRSFNPQNAIPVVTSQFQKSADDDIWQTWYYLCHGNRGFIGWVDEKWFDGTRPTAWHDQVAPTYLEVEKKIGPMLSGAKWIHDGVAIYYSHASIQLGWILDAEAHGKTWVNRNGDEKLGASHLVRRAWEHMLRDSGLQYNFVSYADVIQHGVPKEYKVLILPACLCLSDVEARCITDFCKAGGTVIADYMPGLWDQHGKGRANGGALDELFGVHHDSQMHSSDVFGGRLWCEIDQDVNFNRKSFDQFMTNKNDCIKEENGFDRAVRKMDVIKTNHVGAGTAVLMNLSPQWYNAYRDAGMESAARRRTFIEPVIAGGATRWVDLKNPKHDDFGYEITYWQNNGRTILFLYSNHEMSGSDTGGGNAMNLKSDIAPVTIAFSKPIKGVRDERAGKDLPAGTEFEFNWKRNEAIVLSFEGARLDNPRIFNTDVKFIPARLAMSNGADNGHLIPVVARKANNHVLGDIHFFMKRKARSG